MITCPTCSSSVPDQAATCPSCACALSDESTPTRHQPVGGVPAGADPSPAANRRIRTTNVTDSGAPVDEGTLVTGSVVAGRYRIVGLAGKGGMGELYKAEDLKLNQVVALKFLPDAIAFDSGMLARFHNEVRIARQVSHSAVCRVYDIGEVDGRHFISMEFIDGEDLATLLRRIGRLPGDKAIEIARQICMGLAAAHDSCSAVLVSQLLEDFSGGALPANTATFRSFGYVIEDLLISLGPSVFGGLAPLFFLLLLYLFLRNQWAAAAVMWLIVAAIEILFFANSWATAPANLIIATLLVVAVFRFGLLTAIVWQFVFFVTVSYPLTTDLSIWYASRSLFAIALLLALAIFGTRVSLGGQKIFQGRLLED